MPVFWPGDRVTADDHSPRDRQTSLTDRWQLCRIRSRGRRRVTWGAVLLVAGFLALLWAISLMGPAMDRAGIPVESPWRALPFVVLVPCSLAGLGGLVWLRRDPLLRCPKCNHSLAEGMAPYIAIVTGRCPKCAATLFGEDAASIPAERADIGGAKLLSRAELLAAESAARRAAAPQTIKWALSGGLLLALGGVSAEWLKDVLSSRLGEVWTPFVGPVLLAPGIAVGLWAIAVWARGSRVAKPCPHCSTEITLAGFASITGNCSACGEQAVSDPCPGMPLIPRTHGACQWSLAEFRDLAKRCHDRLWIGCLVGGGLACLWSAPFLLALPAKARLGDSPGTSAAYFACVAGLLLCQCGGVVLWHRYSGRGIRCPACQQELVQFYELVISSRCCYHCGTALFEARDPGEVTPRGRYASC